MIFLLWFCTFGTVQKAIAMCSDDIASKVIANYEFLENQNSLHNDYYARSTRSGNVLPKFLTTKNNWLDLSLGIKVPGGEITVDNTFDFTNYSSFSLEIWYRSETAPGVVVGLYDNNTLQNGGCPHSALLQLHQNWWSVDAIHVLMDNNDGICKDSYGSESFQNRFPYSSNMTTNHKYIYHIVVTVDNNNSLFNTTASTESIVKIYYNGIETTESSAIGGKYTEPFFVRETNWDQVILKIGHNIDNSWNGDIYKVALYNTALNSSEVAELKNHCLKNSKPWAPSFIQHVSEDTLVDIILNGLNNTDLTEKIDASIYEPKFSYDDIQISNIPKILGESKHNLGTRVYDLEGGNQDHKFFFKIDSLPEKKSIFNYLNTPVRENFGWGPTDSLTLNYQAVLNEQSWEYSLDLSGWKVNKTYTTFQYRVSDGIDWSEPGTITIIVDPMSDPYEVSAPLSISVRTGTSQKILLISTETEVNDKFINQPTVYVNQVNITQMPKGTLQYCNSQLSDCESCSTWKDVPIGKIIGSNSSKILPCLNFIPDFHYAIQHGLSGTTLMYTDTIKFRLIYGDGLSNSLFVESARSGKQGIVNLKILNPFYAIGDAPFIKQECAIVEDQKTMLNISYIKPSDYKGSIDFKIMKLNSNFKGTLYINGKSWNATTSNANIIAQTVAYMPPSNNYTFLSKSSFNKGKKRTWLSF